MTRSRPRQIVYVLWRTPGLIYLKADRLTTNMLPPKMTSLYEGGTPSLFIFWSNLPYKSRIRVFLSRISLQMSGFWATCRMSATTFLGSRTTKLLRTLYVCTIPTARKHQLEHHLLPDAICRIRTIDSCQSKAHLNRKGRRHQCFLVTVLSNVRSEAKLFYLDAHAPTSTTLWVSNRSPQ